MGLLSESNSAPYYENYVFVKLRDMLDMCLVIIESGADLTLLDFFLDLFPVMITESDIDDYFGSYYFISDRQVKDLQVKSKIILERYRNR